MTSTPLPYTDRISVDSSASMREQFVEVSMGDGYVQAARNGINSSQESWNVTWRGLEAGEAKVLRSLFRLAGGKDTFGWQHPLSDEEEQWAVVDHGVAPDSNGGTSWNYSATLVKRYV